MKISSYKITTMGLLIAWSIILTRIASLRIAIGGVEGIRIGFGGLPIILGGVLFAPLFGGLVGAISDLVRYFSNPMGAYMPHFTLTSALSGIIPALILKLSQENELNVLELGTAIATGQIITSLVLVPYFLHTLFGLPWKILIPPRIIGVPIHIFIYAYTINMILKRKCLIYSNNEA